MGETQRQTGQDRQTCRERRGKTSNAIDRTMVAKAAQKQRYS